MKTWIFFFTAMSMIACSKKQSEQIKPIEQPKVETIDSSRYFKLYFDNELVYTEYVNFKSNSNYKVFLDLYNAGNTINFIRGGYNEEIFTQQCRKDYSLKSYFYQNQERLSIIEGLIEEKIGNKVVKIEFKQYY